MSSTPGTSACQEPDLFDEWLVTAWLPDESLFSLASRLHVLSCNQIASQTCRQLFGHSQRGSQHDLPSRIDEFVTRTRARFGDAESIIRQHTLLPFYLPLHTRATSDNALAAMRSDGIGSLKYQLGLLTSRFRANHPLKACPMCMEEDLQTHYVAYWHLRHQYPGVWVCARHQQWLVESTYKSTGVGRFQWALPGSKLSAQAWRTGSGERSAMPSAALFALAGASRGLAQLPPGAFMEAKQLASTYKVAMERKGYMTSSGRLTPHAGSGFSGHCRALREVEELRTLPSDAVAAIQALYPLAACRRPTHPLWHLTLISWLFEDWETFLGTYQAQGIAQPSKPTASQAQPDKYTPEIRQQAVMMISQQGRSIRQAALAVGADVTTVQAWAAKAGLPVPRRPKLLTDAVRGKIVRDLSKGLGKDVVAHKHGISVPTISKLLRTEAGLHDAWHAARHSAAKRTARDKWLAATGANPTLGAKAVRILEPAAYIWLYRNDRAWLQLQLKALPATPRPKAGLDWDRRDQELAPAVRAAALAIIEQRGSIKLTLQLLYQQLPELRAKLERLERLPLTRRAIQQLTQAGPHLLTSLPKDD